MQKHACSFYQGLLIGVYTEVITLSTTLSAVFQS